MEQDTIVAPTEAPTDAEITSSDTAVAADLVEEELLIEEISIDGMCGVY